MEVLDAPEDGGDLVDEDYEGSDVDENEPSVSNPKSFTWQSSQETYADPKTGVSTSAVTENSVLQDGTRIIKTITTMTQEHVHGATTVKGTHTRTIRTVTEEEMVVGEEMTFWDCVVCCCPCLKKKKKGVAEEGEAAGGGDGDNDKRRWKPVVRDN